MAARASNPNAAFDQVLEFAHASRDQFVALVDSIQLEPIPIAIKDTWKKRDGVENREFGEYVAHRIRAEAGLSEDLKDGLVDLITPTLVEELLADLKPDRGEEKKAIRQIRINKLTREGFVLMESKSDESDPNVARAFYVFKLVIGKRREQNNDKIFKFKLDGTLYRRVIDQALYSTFSRLYGSLPRA